MKQEFEFETLGEQLEAEAEAEVRRSSRTAPPYKTNARPYGPARRPLPPRNFIMRPPVPGRRPPQRPWTPARRPTASWLGSGSCSPRPSECDEQIRWAQSSLNRILNLDLPVDGVMSAEARSALRGFQRQHGLPVTGLVGPDTQQALLGATSRARQNWVDRGDGDSAAATENDQQDSVDADARELLSEFGLPLDEFGLQSEFENWQSGMTDAPRIVDLTAQAVKSQRKRLRDPKTVNTLVLHQMACCFKVKDPLKRFLNHFAPHFAIMADGQILQLHPTAAMTWASNGFNGNSVAVEFAGNFPNTSGKWCLDLKELKKLTPAQAKAYRQANQNQVTPQQVEAGRYLVQHLISTMGLKRIVAHRQSSDQRENDPGPDIWYHVGQWAIDNLGLTDGGPGYKIDKGNAIPDLWRKWGLAKPQPELEFGIPISAFVTGKVDRRSANYIRWVQQSLNRILGLQLAVDGDAREKTKKAISDFQRQRGLLVDGLVGTKTEAALVAAGAGQPPGGIPENKIAPVTPAAGQVPSRQPSTWDKLVPVLINNDPLPAELEPEFRIAALSLHSFVLQQSFTGELKEARASSLMCMLSKLMESGADDRVILWGNICPTQQLIPNRAPWCVDGFQRIDEDLLFRTIKSPADIETVGRQIPGLIFHLKPEFLNIHLINPKQDNVGFLVEALERIDWHIKFTTHALGLRFDDDLIPSNNPRYLLAIKDWMFAQYQNPKSVYSC